MIAHSSFIIVSTLDLDDQKTIENILKDCVESLD